jgi:hypothetical protein
MLPLVARTTEAPGDEPAVNSPELVMVPPPLAIDQTGATVTVLPAASFPFAENCSVPAVAMVWLSGLTTIVATDPLVTVTVAVPETLPLVALTVAVPGALPAVKSPELVMVPLPLVRDHVGVKATVFPWASFPAAANCCVPVTATLAGLGATAIVANGPGGGGVAAWTTIVADPDTLPLMARTVAVPGEAAAVNIPAGVIVPSPLATDHVGVIATGFPAASRPIAVNCRVPEAERVSLTGAITMLASVPPPPDTPVGTFCLEQWMENIAAAVAPATTRQRALRSEGDIANVTRSCSARRLLRTNLELAFRMGRD